ncbi:MAG: glycosyltransferase family 2 protein, partial [Clostridia bacterium]|nr:glycosyltransferase family 2 protein [Clostridia bacterium]
MKTISLCMIVKNEEKVLNRCLKSVKDLVDEVIIVDTGSTDKTKLIAKKYTNNIYDFEWCNDFSKARNYAISKATCNYIMWLDADDVVPANTIKSLLNLKSNMTADIYMLKYDIAFVNNKSTFSYFRERIIKNCSLCKFKGVVHECITPFGKVEKINLSIKHKKINNTKINRNLQIYEQLKKQKQLSAREQYYYARELFDNKKYSQCIKELKVFVKSKDAWTENIIDAYYLMSICYNIKNNKKEIDCLLKTFLYDKPRANICCKIGDVFLKNKNYTVA